MAKRRPLLRLLALLLLVQWVGAFGHCLRASAATLDLGICAAGQPQAQPADTDGKAPQDKARLDCPACSALPGVDLPPAPSLTSPVLWTPFTPWMPDAHAVLHPPARAPPPPARAPPFPA